MTYTKFGTAEEAAHALAAFRDEVEQSVIAGEAARRKAKELETALWSSGFTSNIGVVLEALRRLELVDEHLPYDWEFIIAEMYLRKEEAAVNSKTGNHLPNLPLNTAK